MDKRQPRCHLGPYFLILGNEDFDGISEPIMKQERKPTTGGVLIGSSYDEARTRKINAEAEIAELELAKIRGTLCLTDDVVKAWETVLHACKAKFLSLPTKVAPVVANESDVAVVKDHMENAIREALLELSNYQPAIDPVNTGSAAVEPIAGDEAPDAPAKNVSRRVGRPRKTAGLSK
jgi:hypothetical protein